MTRSDVQGPFPITDDDIAAVNHVFSDGFTERYRRDGLVGVRVPTLNPAIWRFSLADAGAGAMLWRDREGALAAFNVAHRSGIEGWMGPIVVRPDLQGRGVGHTIVTAGVDWLRAQGALVIGLETMPRTVDNIGFYSSLGFVPGPLTVTFTIDAALGEPPVSRIGCYGPQERDDAIAECKALAASVLAGYDFTREIEMTSALALGDTVLLRDDHAVRGFAVCHVAPLIEGRPREELRVLKVVLDDAARTPAMVRALAAYSRECQTARVALRVQSGYERTYRDVLAAPGRVRWTDLRMTLSGFPEARAATGVVLSNWEI